MTLKQIVVLLTKNILVISLAIFGFALIINPFLSATFPREIQTSGCASSLIPECGWPNRLDLLLNFGLRNTYWLLVGVVLYFLNKKHFKSKVGKLKESKKTHL